MNDVKLTAQTFICLWCLTLRGVENHGILVISEVLSKQKSKKILWEDRVGGGRCGASLGESPPVSPPTPGRDREACSLPLSSTQPERSRFSLMQRLQIPRMICTKSKWLKIIC